MKLKQLPEDFKVEEINHFDILKQGQYRLYLLEKKGMDTFYVLSYLSKQNDIPISDFGIAGLKDRHALTKQYLTIPAKYELKAKKEQNFTLKLLGFVDKPLKIGNLIGNRFEIVIRDLKKGETDGPLQKAETIPKMGVPNYFDSQRFGSVISKEFMAHELIKKNYEKAVAIFLTSSTKFESRDIKRQKKSILDSWGNFSRLKLNNRTFQSVIDEYTKTKDWLKAYKKIPANLREIYISAYQSYLWNECIKELLRRIVNTKYLYTIEYNIGSLLYYKRLTDDEMNKLPKTFRTISQDMKATELEKAIIDKILSKEGLKLGDFDIKKATDNFFKSSERPVLLRPEGFKINEPSKDELNDKGRGKSFKMIVSFMLPKGSYATVVTKRLVNR